MKTAVLESIAKPKTGSTQRVLFSVVLALFVAAYVELYYECIRTYQDGLYEGLLTNTVNFPVAIRCFAIAALTFILVMVFLQRAKRLLAFIYRHRMIIGVAIIVFCTCLELSGSSLSCMKNIVGSGGDDGLLFGIPRDIRSDEWRVTTPLFFSQAYNGYAPISDIVRGEATDITMVYQLSSWSLITLFEPMQWGYLFLGSARGLAFYWSARYVVLFLVSFECARLYTRDNKHLSAVAAILIAFSPISEWWGLMSPILVYGQGIVIAFHYYLRAKSFKTRAACCLAFFWLCGCFLFIMYPAWMVPFFYVLAALCLCDLVPFIRRSQVARSGDQPALAGAENVDGIGEYTGVFNPLKRRDVLVIVGCIIALALSVAFIFLSSADAIAAETGTVYPGKRFETGGHNFSLLFNYGSALFYPLVNPGLATPNVCEASPFFSLFPLGILLALFVLRKRRKADAPTVFLLVIEAFLVLFLCVPIPEIVARITLISNVPPSRALAAIGFIDIILLLRALALWQQLSAEQGVATVNAPHRKALFIAAAIVFTLAVMLLSRRSQPEVMGAKYLLLLAIVLGCLALALYRLLFAGAGEGGLELFTAVFLTVGIAGFCVNPIQMGATPITDSNFSTAVKAVQASNTDRGLWLATDADRAIPDICAANGARTINSVNSIPDVARWHLLDPSGSYEYVYNRFAHIVVHLTEEPTSFELIAADAFQLNLNYDDLRTLNVEYIASGTELGDEPQDGIIFEKIETSEKYAIYRIDYEW